ncbi:MAG: O-antigen ligase family protein [Burkholderiales bacterium]|nr:O-antigen ligase family protein [Burkholderiales bacterium]
MLLVVLLPLPVLWYPIQDLPLGRKTMDMLVFASTIGIIRGNRPWESAPKKGLLFTLIAFSYLSTWNTSFRFGFSAPISLDNPVLADWKNYSLMIFLYFVSYNGCRTEEEVKRLTNLMMFVVLFIIIQNYRSILSGETYSESTRAAGPFQLAGLNSNHFGAFLANYGVAAFALFLSDVGVRRWLYLTVSIGIVYPLFYTYSRGSYLAATAGVFILGIMKSRIIILFVILLLIFWKDILPTTVVDRIQMTETASGQLEDSAAQRLVLWQLAEDMFTNSPLFGIGFNGFFFASAHLSLHNVHNFYLQSAAEQGVIGILLFISVLVRSLASGFTLFRTGSSPYGKALGLAFLACSISVSVTNVFGDRFSQLYLGGYFFILMGAVDRMQSLSPP